MAHGLNLVKLSVGTESVESLSEWQSTASARRHKGHLCHVTRMWPRRESEILSEGSIFWVIRGMILARQKILGFQAYDSADGIKRCAILLDETLVRTLPVPRKAFQGWRYLETESAPQDLDTRCDLQTSLPPDLEHGLTQLGVLARSRK